MKTIRRDRGKYTEERDRRPKIQKGNRGRERLEKYIEKRYRGERHRGEKYRREIEERQREIQGKRQRE
jgi:hypothetical protein